MKHVKLFALAATFLFAVGASAQVKIGYISTDRIVFAMPELSRDKINIDTVGTQFVNDSIVPMLTYKQEQLKKKELELSDTTKPKQVRDIIGKEYFALAQELNGAEEYINQIFQAIQSEFLEPYYIKAHNAIKEVAKKGGYTHVMDPSAFVIAPEGDNLTERVLTELKIPIPKAPTAQ